MPHDTATAPAASHAAAGHPIDTSRWKLTLPIADPHAPHGHSHDDPKPLEVERPELRAFSNDDDDYNHYFYVRDGAVEYDAPVKGVTTSKESGSTRTELRELDAHGNEVTWKIGSGTATHTLTCTLTCDATGASPKKKCIVGQIHDADGTPPIYLSVEVNGDSAKLVAYLRGMSNNADQNQLLDELKPGTVFSYRLRVENGECRVFVARGGVDALPSSPKKTFSKAQLGNPGDCFFKAGAYNKSDLHGSGRVVVQHRRLDLQ